MTSSELANLRERFNAFRGTPESFTITLQMSLSRVILEALEARGWSQRELAKRADVADSFLSRVIHGDANWTASTAGRLLCALGQRAVVQPKHEGRSPLKLVTDFVQTTTYSSSASVNLHDKEELAKAKEVWFEKEKQAIAK